MHDVDCEIDHIGVIDPFTCDDAIIPLVQQACKESFYAREILPEVAVSGSKDCSFMINRVQERVGKATYMMFGMNLNYPHHHPPFDFQEVVLSVAIEAFINMIREAHGNE